jgi:hypothetical protein
MSGAAITLAAFIALAARPECGGTQASAHNVPVAELSSRASVESGFDPLAIGVNGFTHRFQTAAEAIQAAKELDAININYDAGIMQINRRNWARFGLTYETAFNACANLAAGVAHIVDDLAAAWDLARRRYNCGRMDCSQGYAQKVALRRQQLDPAIKALLTGNPPPSNQPPPPPAQPFSAPPPDVQVKPPPRINPRGGRAAVREVIIPKVQ